MKKEQIEENEKIVKLYSDDGYLITDYSEEKDDITMFAAYSSVTTLYDRVKNYYEISVDKVAELTSLKNEALNRIEEDNGEDGIEASINIVEDYAG